MYRDNNIWTEKYRPSSLDEIYSQDLIIDILTSSSYNINMPHLLFSGPQGCGKTSTIMALAQNIFGSDYKNNIIEMNASDERGINVVRDKIKYYAKQSNVNNHNKNGKSTWKIIILDEADTMAPDSQFALRRIIEQYSNSAKFCIICNYLNKIIDPIISRCSYFTFNKISNENIIKRLNYICIKEHLEYDQAINKIADISKGDMRYAINLLELYHNSNKNIKYNIVDELSGVIPDVLFNEIIINVYDKNYDKLYKSINNIYNNGYSIVNQINLFHNFILNLKTTDDKKSKLFLKLMEIDKNLIKGGEEYIQYLNFFYFIVITL